MDIQLPSFPILIASFIFMLVALKIIRKKKSSRNLPPGPWKLPIIGHMHLFAGSIIPHRKLRELAKQYGPLMHIQIGQVPAVVVSTPEVAQQFMKTHDAIFAQRPQLVVPDILAYGCSDIIFSPQGEYWRLVRKICATELLSAKCVQSYRSIREEEVSKCMRLISSHAGCTINLSEIIFSMIFGITTRAAFSEKMKDQEELINVNREGRKQFTGDFILADVFPSLKFLRTITGIKGKLETLKQKVDIIVERMINERRSSTATRKTDHEDEQHRDLLDALLYVQKHGGLEFTLTDDNIKAVIMDMFSAGTEATSATLDWTMSELLKNPRVMERAQAEVRKVFGVKGDVDEAGLQELKYLKLVIKESLRLRPSIPLLLPRESVERYEILGYEIPPKTRVIINAWAMARDPKHWSEPTETFLPERFIDNSLDYKGGNFEYIPFGAGRRICPGIQFGVSSVELGLAHLLFHFDWKLPNGAKPEELDMTESFSVTVQRRDDLYVVPCPTGFANGTNH